MLIPRHPAKLLQKGYSLQRVLSEYASIQAIGSLSVHANAVASNPQMEDRHSFDDYGDAQILSVHDGHSGYACAESLSTKLNPAIYDQLAKGHPGIQKACVDLDKQFTHSLLDKKGTLEDLDSALSGAVSATAIVKGNQLTTVHTGDVRVVLGSQVNGSYRVSHQTADHNPEENKSENARLKKEHPGEPYVVYAGRVLGGLMPSRAFGDGNYKWTIPEMRKLREILTLSNEPGTQLSLRKLQPPPHYATPPYVTAEPEVTTLTLKPSDKFLIIASDGLWDRMSSEQAVQHVEEYLKSPSDNAAVYLTQRAIETVLAGTQVPYGMTLEQFKQTVAEQLMQLPSSKSRRYRDDITVLVVFFDQQQQAKL